MSQAVNFLKDWGPIVLLLINLFLTFGFNRKIEKYKFDLQQDLTIRNLQFQKELTILSYLWEKTSHLRKSLHYAVTASRESSPKHITDVDAALDEIEETVSIRSPFIQSEIGEKCSKVVHVGRRLSIELKNIHDSKRAEKNIDSDRAEINENIKDVERAIRERILTS